MFRQIATILILAAFSLQTFNRAVLMVDYYVNTASFVENCENKASPELNCAGKCQVSAKMQDEEKKEQQNPDRKAGNQNEIISSKSFYCTIACGNLTTIHTYCSCYKFSIQKKLFSEIFHPPGEQV